MTIVQNCELLNRRLAAYSSERKNLVFTLREQDSQEKDDTALAGLITQVCSRLLEEHPELINRATNQTAERDVLLNLITQYAEQYSIRSGLYINELQKKVVDSLFGYGPLQYLIDDPDISDIDAVSPSEITVKKNGVRLRISTCFENAADYETYCRLLIIRQGGLINENDSHCRVTDSEYHLRINVTVPPRSLKYSSLSIRKHSASAKTLEELASVEMLNINDIALLKHLAASDNSILICGKGGSGKTTLLRSLINVMPPLERILIAESDSEIYAEKACCLSQRIRRSNEGGRPVSLRDLISDGLTMSLDTYCIGEIVGDEAYEFIRAAYSGHRCLATVHAISAEDALDRLISLARGASSGEHEHTLRNMLARSLDIIIYLEDFKIGSVIRVIGYNKERYDYEYEFIRENKNAGTGTSFNINAESLVPSQK